MSEYPESLNIKGHALYCITTKEMVGVSLSPNKHEDMAKDYACRVECDPRKELKLDFMRYIAGTPWQYMHIRIPAEKEKR